jgi:hypothetical protein
VRQDLAQLLRIGSLLNFRQFQPGQLRDFLNFLFGNFHRLLSAISRQLSAHSIWLMANR